MFEGEYLDEERWNGKGREYNLVGIIMLFKGEYLEGKKLNGKIYEHDDNGDLVGEHLKGKYVNNVKNINSELIILSSINNLKIIITQLNL